MDNTNDTVNMLYTGAVLSGLVIGYTMLANKMFKIKSVNLDKIDVKDLAKLSLIITGASYTQSMLIKKGVLPARNNEEIK